MNEHGIKMEKTVQALTSFSCSASKTTLQRTLLSPVYGQHTPCLRKKQVTLIFDITYFAICWDIFTIFEAPCSGCCSQCAVTPDFIPPDLWCLNSLDLNPAKLFFPEHHAREGVPNTHSEYRWVETSASSGVGRAGPQLQLLDSACDSCVKAQRGYFDEHLRWIYISSCVQYVLYSTIRMSTFHFHMTGVPQCDWKRSAGCPHISRLARMKNDLSSHNLSVEDATELALDRPLHRLLSASVAMHSNGASWTMMTMIMNANIYKLHCK